MIFKAQQCHLILDSYIMESLLMIKRGRGIPGHFKWGMAWGWGWVAGIMTGMANTIQPRLVANPSYTLSIYLGLNSSFVTTISKLVVFVFLGTFSLLISFHSLRRILVFS